MFYSIILFWVMFCYVLQYTTYTYTYTYTYIHAGICMLADEYIYTHVHACMHAYKPPRYMYVCPQYGDRLWHVPPPSSRCLNCSGRHLCALATATIVAKICQSWCCWLWWWCQWWRWRRWWRWWRWWLEQSCASWSRRYFVDDSNKDDENDDGHRRWKDDDLCGDCGGIRMVMQ